MGETTVRTPSRMVISIPNPPKLPVVSTWSSLYISGGMKLEWGSSVLSIPLIAP